MKSGAFFIGLGLRLVRSWGFWLFLAYTPLLLVFNVREIVARANLFSIGALGEAVNVKFEHGGRIFERVAGVARIDSEGAALAFRALSEVTREALKTTPA